MTRDRSSPLRWAATRPELVPGILALAVLTGWTAAGGGFAVTASAPGGLFLLGLLGATAFAYRNTLGEIPLALRIALALLAAFVVWSFLSISWADAKGEAWEGANRTLIYFLVFALFAVVPWRSRSALLLLGGWSLAVALVGTIAVIEASNAAEPILAFVSRRFADPTGYHNANAALFASAFWPAILIASRRETPWALRGVMLATAAVLFELALLPQSRGWLIAFPLSAVIALAVVPGRVRLLCMSIPLIASVALAADPILDVFDVARADGDLGAALDSALSAILLTALAMLPAGAALAWVDRGLRAELGAWRAAKVVVAVVAAAGVVAAGVVAVGETGNPVRWVDERWEDFKDAGPEEQVEGSRLGGSLGSNRYDFWRVSMDAWSDQPLAGVGIDNFGAEYLRERRSGEEPLHPHSLPVKVLSQTGLVGALLFVGFLAAAGTAVLRVRLRATAEQGRVVAATAVVVVAYWLLHSSGDWFWALPALSAPAFACLGLAASLSRRLGAEPAPEPAADPGPRPRWRRPALAAAALAALTGVVAVVSLTLPWRAQVDVDAAAGGWGGNPAAAYERLDRAHDLDFLSARAALTEGAIAARLNNRERMRAAFERALEREPQSWYALLELGALDALEKRRPEALAHLARARRLNPGDPVIEEVERAAEAGRAFPLRRIDRAMLERVCGRLGRTGATSYCDERASMR